MKNSKKIPKAFSLKAFSLIELSIVILIVGILVAGVTQSSRLVARMKLFSAQSATTSSDVASIPNLTMWLETTLDNSLVNSSGGSQLDDGNTISSWNDINPQTSNKINLSQSNASIQPTYKTNGINGFPSINFNGSNQYLINMSSMPVNMSDKDYTIILVWNPTSAEIGGMGQVVISQSDNPGSCNQLASIWVLSNTYGFAGGCNDFRTVNIVSKTPYISILTINNNLASNNISVYSNSNTPTVGNTGGGSASLNIGIGNFLIGARYQNGNIMQYYVGLISEAIIYDRALKLEEIKSVNAYLGKKYGIKIQ